VTFCGSDSVPVHTKLGAYNTLVWVTSLDKGLPVAKARVRVFVIAIEASQEPRPYWRKA